MDTKRKLVLMLIVALTLLVSSQALALEQTSNLCLLIHSRSENWNQFGHFYTASWVIAPAVTENSGQWLVLPGIGYERFGLSWELTAGGLLEQGWGTSVLDFRFGYKSTRSVYSVWTNFQFVDLFDQFDLYYYGELDRELFDGNLYFGLETENLWHYNGETDFSIGDHFKFPLSEKTTLITVAQWHEGGRIAFWARLVWEI